VSRQVKQQDIKKGDHFTFLGDFQHDENYYVANEDCPTDLPATIEVKHFYDGVLHDDHIVRLHRDSFVTLIDRDTHEPQEGNNTMNTDNAATDAKFDLAVDFGLQTKFNYTNERGETADRRLKPTGFDGEYVEGESFDLYGRSEGFKRFRLDRINDAPVIR